MYKVLLIDDEPIIRKGLKNIINWQEYGCEVCGEAADGKEGIEKVESLQPDIVFTDIRMPEIDGLEMIRILTEQPRVMKIIILTGFTDFEYVKEALVLGAFDYLVKPTKLEEIKKVTSRAVKELDMIIHTEERAKALKQSFNRYLPKLREKLLYEVMLGITTDSAEIERRTKDLGLEIDQFYLVLVNSHPNDSEKNKSVAQYGILHTFEDMLSDEYVVYSIAVDYCNSAFMITFSEDEMEDRIFTRCHELQQMMMSGLNMSVSLAVSESGQGIEDLLMCYSQCCRAMDYGMLTGSGSFMLFSDIADVVPSRMNIRLQGIGQLIIEGIACGSASATQEHINALRAEIKKQEVIDATVMGILTSIAADIKQQLSGEQYQTHEDMTHEQILDDIKRYADKAIEISMHNSRENMRLVMKKAIEFLEENYQRQITLAEVAGAVFVSPYYISRMFKRETGQTMTEYLNDMRIKNACTLLENVAYKVYQIGEMVGIPDAHYFSRLFKNSTGLTPSEYRNKMT